MSSVQRIVLSDEVKNALDQAQDADEMFALLNAAGDFYLCSQRREQRPMPLEEALKTIRQVAAGIEALERSVSTETKA